mgnify:CR=1 FL=1
MKNVSILGSTGSIGTQTLDVIRRNADINVVALAAGTRVADLAEQVREFKPQLVCIGKEELVPELKTLIGDMDVKIVSGDEGLIEAATIESAEIVVTAVVGMMGITPTVEAIKAHKDIALANKETLVCAGHIIMSLAKECNVNIYPVDSEHSAIFQCLQGNEGNKLKGIILTASGGPFFGKTKSDLEGVTVEQALNHPNWSMGRKITIDSATLMNKGLEFIEAMWLFKLRPEQIEIVVHRQSVVHSAVEYEDNSVIAQLGVPDMKIPIQYALLYPERVECDVKKLSLTDYGKLTFEKPDYDTFDCLRACIKAVTIGGNLPAAVNGANEEAVAAFLDGRIDFLDIGRIVMNVCENTPRKEIKCVEDVLEADRKARERAKELIGA